MSENPILYYYERIKFENDYISKQNHFAPYIPPHHPQQQSTNGNFNNEFLNRKMKRKILPIYNNHHYSSSLIDNNRKYVSNLPPHAEQFLAE